MPGTCYWGERIACVDFCFSFGWLVAVLSLFLLLLLVGVLVLFSPICFVVAVVLLLSLGTPAATCRVQRIYLHSWGGCCYAKSSVIMAHSPRIPVYFPNTHTQTHTHTHTQVRWYNYVVCRQGYDYGDFD